MRELYVNRHPPPHTHPPPTHLIHRHPKCWIEQETRRLWPNLFYEARKRCTTLALRWTWAFIPACKTTIRFCCLYEPTRWPHDDGDRIKTLVKGSFRCKSVIITITSQCFHRKLSSIAMRSLGGFVDSPQPLHMNSFSRTLSRTGTWWLRTLVYATVALLIRLYYSPPEGTPSRKSTPFIMQSHHKIRRWPQGG